MPPEDEGAFWLIMHPFATLHVSLEAPKCKTPGLHRPGVLTSSAYPAIQPRLFPQSARSNLLLHERGEQCVQMRRRVDRIRVHVRLVRAGHRVGLR